MCPIRSQHSLDRLEMVLWESVPRGSSARAWKLSSRLFSRPDWLALGLRGCSSPRPLSLIKTKMAVRNAANFRAQYLRWLLFLYEIFEVKNSLILYVVSGFKYPRHRPKRFKGAHSHNSLRRSGTRATFTILRLGALNSFFFCEITIRRSHSCLLVWSSLCSCWCLLVCSVLHWKTRKKSACSVQAIFWLTRTRSPKPTAKLF